MNAGQRIWHFLEQICKPPTTQKWEGLSQGKCLFDGDVQVQGTRAGQLDMVTLYSKNPWFYLSLISSDFCSSLKIFTNTSWKLCSHTMFLSCLLSCHGKETSSLDTSCAPGADNICKERIIPECKVVTSGWCLSLLCPQSIRDTSNFTVPIKSTARLMRNFLGRRL